MIDKRLVYKRVRTHVHVAKVRQRLCEREAQAEESSMGCYSYVIFLVSLLSVLAGARSQAECPLIITPDELGSVDAPSREGLIASSYEVGDAAEPPLVQILDYNLVCLAAGVSLGRYRWVSLVVRYICDGAVPALAQGPCGDNLEVTAQFDFGCVESGGEPPRWEVGVPFIGVNTYVSFPADGDFSTPVRISCSFCVHPEEGMAALGVAVEVESHCAGWYS